MGGQTKAARRRASDQTGRAKAAAARVEAARRERRRRVAVVAGAAVAVLAIVAVIVVVGAASSSKKPAAGRADAAAAVVAAVTAVPATTLNAVASGAATDAPKPVSDNALSSNGRPEILYIGAEFCPYCAAERWPLVQALSRFGKFSGLKTVRSSPTDVHPNTATFSFHGATYTSDTVAFVGRELETVAGAPLDHATAAETALWKKYTGPGSFPFLAIAGKYVSTHPSYDPAVLSGLTADEIAAQLADPTSKVARAIDGAANVMTAAICRATNGSPAAVCTAAGVTAAAKMLSG